MRRFKGEVRHLNQSLSFINTIGKLMAVLHSDPRFAAEPAKLILDNSILVSSIHNMLCSYTCIYKYTYIHWCISRYDMYSKDRINNSNRNGLNWFDMTLQKCARLLAPCPIL